MNKWFKYLVAGALVASLGLMIGCGDKNKRDSFNGFNPGFGWNPGFGGPGGYPINTGVSSVAWWGELTKRNNSAYEDFLEDTGMCGNIARSTICSLYDGGDPQAVLYLDPSRISAGVGTAGQLTFQPRSNGHFQWQSPPVTLNGQFRLVNGNSLIRAENIYGNSYNYNRETYIDVTGNPASGVVTVAVFYRTVKILEGNLQIYQQNNWGWGW